jgi:ligand-binding sensor domain-containing protein
MSYSKVRAWSRCLLAAGAALGCLEGGRDCAAAGVALDPTRPLKQHSLDVWTSADGLPQNSVYAISQTSDGYLWMGTQEGLVRFDGVRFTVFDGSNTPALSNPSVSVLARGADDVLWMGTESGRLIRFAEGAFQAYEPPAAPTGPSVTALVEVPPAHLWVGTAEGLAELKEGRLVAAPPGGLPKGAVRALYADHRGVLWVGTDGGLTRHGSQTYTARDGLAGDIVTAIAEDVQGDLWIGTTQGLSRRRPDGFVTYTTKDGLPANWVRALLVDRKGAVWIATEGGLARHWEGRFESLTPADGLSRPSVTTLFEDRDGSLWAGTNGGGLNRLQAGPILTYSLRHGLKDEVVYALAGDGEDGLWVGTIRGGVSHFRNGTFTPFPVPNPFASNAIRSLHYDPETGLWIGSDQGLYRFVEGRLQACPPREGFPARPVRTILRDASGTMWFGTDGEGLTGWKDGRFVHYRVADGLPSDRVRTLAQARDGGLWMGTYGGVARLKDGRFQSFSAKDGLSSDLVRALYEDEGGTLWIGTFGGGLNRLHQGRITAYGQGDGLFSNVVYHILEDQRGNLWMSCNKGIFRVAKRDLEARVAGRAGALHSVAYDESAGMLSRECNSGSASGWKTADGHLWFPTLKGLVRVDPQGLISTVALPAAIVEQVFVDDAPIDHHQPVSLPPGRHRVQLAYTAPTFVHSHGLRFRVRLDGFETDWREVTRRDAFYTNIPPGEYTFRVSAIGANGIIAGSEASLAFAVRPHFHQTAAFFVLCAVLGVAILGGAYALRVSALKARERQLARRVDEALASLKMLRGLLPICAWCRKVRDDHGYWNQLEQYIREHSEADFSHGICPDCYTKHFPGRAASLAEPEPGVK